jgi:hypothetical protein
MIHPRAGIGAGSVETVASVANTLRSGRLSVSEVIGMYQEDRLVCIPCANGEGEEANAEALPDGFTCDECEEVVNV